MEAIITTDPYQANLAEVIGKGIENPEYQAAYFTHLKQQQQRRAVGAHALNLQNVTQ